MVNSIVCDGPVEIALDIADIFRDGFADKLKKEILEYVIRLSFILDLGANDCLDKTAVFGKKRGGGLNIISVLVAICAWQRLLTSVLESDTLGRKTRGYLSCESTFAMFRSPIISELYHICNEIYGPKRPVRA